MRFLLYIGLISIIPVVAACNSAEKKSNADCGDSAQYPPHALIIPLGHVTVRIDEMFGAPKFTNDSVEQLDTVRIVLGITGIDEDINSKSICVVACAAESVSVMEKYCSTYFFNQDGSGAVYELDEIGNYCTDWKKLLPDSVNTYVTSPMKRTHPTFPIPTKAPQKQPRSTLRQRKTA